MSVLYGALAGTSTTSDLYSIDPSTGAATSIGPIGFAVTGLAYDPTAGVMYGATSNNSASHPHALITINISTGAGTLVADFSSGQPMGDIAFDSAGQLYGLQILAPRGLKKIDKATAVVTDLATTLSSAFGGGLALNASDVAYAMVEGNDGDLWTMNTTTGNQTVVATLSGAPGLPGTAHAGVGAATFDGSGSLWAVFGGNGVSTYYIVKVDTATAVVTSVGVTTALLDALAWINVVGPIAASEAVTGTERVRLNVLNQGDVAVGEDVLVGESTAAALTIAIAKSEGISVAESVAGAEPAHGAVVSEMISVGTSASAHVSVPAHATSEAISVGESVLAAVVTPPFVLNLAVAVSEHIGVIDSPLGTGLSIAVSTGPPPATPRNFLIDRLTGEVYPWPLNHESEDSIKTLGRQIIRTGKSMRIGLMRQPTHPGPVHLILHGSLIDRSQAQYTNFVRFFNECDDRTFNYVDAAGDSAHISIVQFDARRKLAAGRDDGSYFTYTLEVEVIEATAGSLVGYAV